VTPVALAALHGRAMASRPWSEVEFAALLAAPGVFLVCNGPSSFALGRIAADEAELLTIAVAPEARRAGLGLGSLAGFETEAAARGAIRAFLEVDTDNLAALALYRAARWADAGRRRGYYRASTGPGTDALVMTKSLLPNR